MFFQHQRRPDHGQLGELERIEQRE